MRISYLGGVSYPASSTLRRGFVIPNQLALELLRLANARVRFDYCSSSDDLDQTLELTKIGPNPRGNGGRTAEEAGNSLINTVSVVGTSPLTPGVTYEFWLTGHNSRGDGPESPHVTHTVIAVPPPQGNRILSGLLNDA